MIDLVNIARILAVFGIVVLVTAGILYLISYFDIPLGNLPGDLLIKRENFTCVIPLISSLIVSVVLTLLINLILSIFRK